MTQITIVCGPPCAGKNHHVDEHAGPDDVVIDWDQIARELGSPRTHHHAKTMFDAIAREYDRRLAELEENPPAGHRAWIIRGLPEQEERDAWAERFDADVVALVPPMETCLQRARRRDHASYHEWAIRRWYQRAGKMPAQAGPDPMPASSTRW
jgi:5-methylcytosine-specific restriction protein A